MIIDTSAWIEYLRATHTPAHRRLASALQRRARVYVLPPIRQEVLQGARNPADFLRLQRLMDQFPEPDLPPARELATLAARLYAQCRWQGITIRSPNDCLIAAGCLFSRQPLLAHDRDFGHLAGIEPRLKLVSDA